MAPRLEMQFLQAGRALIGAALVVAPQSPGGDWVGDDARTPGGRVAMRALGAREVLVGIGALRAARSGSASEAVAWSLGLAACDVVDGVATLAEARELPRMGAAVGAFALSSAVAGAWIALRLRG
jgi:hypothetical protein